MAIFFYASTKLYFFKNLNIIDYVELIIGESAKLPTCLVGTKDVTKDIPILILLGHADSQRVSGAVNSGEVVDKFGLNPIDP